MIKPLIKDGFISPFGSVRKNPPTSVSQPLKTFTETLIINNPFATKISSSYILMVKNGIGDFSKWGANRAEDRGWKILKFEGGHYSMREQPDELVKKLEIILKL